MITRDLVSDAQASLQAISQQVSTLRFGTVHERTYPLAQIRNGVPENDLKAWLDEELGPDARLPAIYSIQADTVETAKMLRAEFEVAKQKKQLALPRLNLVDAETSALYVGSSRNIRQRVKQHLWKGPDRTYAMHMKHWVPDAPGCVTLRVQSVQMTTEREALQIVEDTLWRKLTPMFGKAGAR